MAVMDTYGWLFPKIYANHILKWLWGNELWMVYSCLFHVIPQKYAKDMPKIWKFNTYWWFQPLWKIWVSWDYDIPNWMESQNPAMFQSPPSRRGFDPSPTQWEFQDPKLEVLYHVRPYFLGISPYIGLIYARYLQFRFLRWPVTNWMFRSLPFPYHVPFRVAAAAPTSAWKAATVCGSAIGLTAWRPFSIHSCYGC